MVKRAVLLAGGRGTRLAVAFPGVPKPLVPIAGIPMAERLVRQLVAQGIDSITFTVHHGADQIRSHFGDGSSFLCQIDYLEETQPLGSAGILHAFSGTVHETVLVVYGDVLADVDWQRMASFHRTHRADATLLVHPNDHPHDSDLVVLGPEDRIEAVLSKPHPPGRIARNMVNAGAYLLEPICWSHIPPNLPTDFGKDLLPRWCQELRVFGYNTPEYIKDMGTPERVLQGEKALASGKVAARSLRTPQVAVFLDRDGVINEDTDLIHRPEDFHLFPWTAEALRLLNQSPYLGIVVTNQSVIARGMTDEPGLNRIHAHMDTELGKAGAFVDALYYCPHHPDGGFPGEVPAYKIACTCRKPSPGMLMQAADRYGIDLPNSWMVGDSERDVRAAQAAGVTSLGVRTGHGLKNSRVQPDFLFDHLLDAIRFVVDQPHRALIEEFWSRYRAHRALSDAPFVVAVGGLARSGKSTAAAALAREARLQNVPCTTVHLDQWIRPSADRLDAPAPWDAYPQERLERELTSFLQQGQPIVAPGYALHAHAEPTEKRYTPASVVLVEGVVALSLESVRTAAHWTVSVSTSPDVRRERFDRFMAWRGRSHEAEAVWNLRERTEVPTVEKDLIFAETSLLL